MSASHATHPSFKLNACPQCNYDLSGLPESGRCPECGFAYAPGMFVLTGRGWRLRLRWWEKLAIFILLGYFVLAATTTITVSLFWWMAAWIGVWIAADIRRRIERHRYGGDERYLASLEGLTRLMPDRLGKSIPWRSFRTVIARNPLGFMHVLPKDKSEPSRPVRWRLVFRHRYPEALIRQPIDFIISEPPSDIRSKYEEIIRRIEDARRR